MEKLSTVVASELGVPERTFRRMVDGGAIRARKVSDRKMYLSESEEGYLRSHLELISALRESLRTERGVRLAVLFGSRARGDDTSDSDVDVFVNLIDRSPRYLTRLTRRLEDKTGFDMQLVPSCGVERVPVFMEEVHADGRVLIDRDKQWSDIDTLLRSSLSAA